MNLSVRDPETLELVHPKDAEAYLAAKRWARVKERPREYSIWERADEAGRVRRATVPLDREFADYAERAFELLSVISQVEKRSQLAVFEDVFRIRLDGISVRSEHPADADGSIPVYEGAQLVENAVEMVEAAACSTVEPKPRFMARRPKLANEYTDRLRMGQTSRGSYVLHFYSPLRIPSDPVNVDQLTLPLFSGAPAAEGFGRRAVKTLARALQAVRVGSAAMTETADVFTEAVRQGVSSNLLSAVAGMLGDEALRVEVAIRWSPFVALTESLPTSVIFERKDVDSLEKAAERFREQAPDEDTLLTGHVVQLNRTSEMFGDRIFLETLVNDRKSRVALMLWNDDYKRAMTAIEQRKQLQCRGRLVKFGRSYRLEEPRDVLIIE